MEFEILKNESDWNIDFLYHKPMVHWNYNKLRYLFDESMDIKMNTKIYIGWIIKFKDYKLIIYSPKTLSDIWFLGFPIYYSYEIMVAITKEFEKELETRKFSIWFNEFNQENPYGN